MLATARLSTLRTFTYDMRKNEALRVLRSCEHTMKKQFEYFQALDSSNTCEQCTGINGGRNERNGVKTYYCAYVRTYTVLYSNYLSKFHYSLLINKNIGIEDTMETSSSDKRTELGLAHPPVQMGLLTLLPTYLNNTVGSYNVI